MNVVCNAILLVSTCSLVAASEHGLEAVSVSEGGHFVKSSAIQRHIQKKSTASSSLLEKDQGSKEEYSPDVLDQTIKRLARCDACYNDLTVLGEIEQRNYFTPDIWHRMFVAMMDKKLAIWTRPKGEYVKYPWTINKAQFRLSLPNCNIEEFWEAANVPRESELLDIYHWNDVMENADLDLTDSGDIDEGNFRITKKEVAAAGLEPYHKKECGELEPRLSFDKPILDTVTKKDNASNKVVTEPTAKEPAGDGDKPEDEEPVDLTGVDTNKITVNTATQKKNNDNGQVKIMAAKSSSNQGGFKFNPDTAVLADPSVIESFWSGPASTWLGKFTKEKGWKHKFCIHVGTTLGHSSRLDRPEDNLKKVSGCNKFDRNDAGDVKSITGEQCFVKNRADTLVNFIKEKLGAAADEVEFDANYIAYTYTDKFGAIVMMSYTGDEPPKCNVCACERMKGWEDRAHNFDNKYTFWNTDHHRCDQVGACCSVIDCIGPTKDTDDPDSANTN